MLQQSTGKPLADLEKEFTFLTDLSSTIPSVFERPHFGIKYPTHTCGWTVWTISRVQHENLPQTPNQKRYLDLWLILNQ